MTETQIIPAGAGEIMQYIVHPFNDNTMRFILHYPCLLDAQALCQAALAVVSSVDVLHASFVAGEKRAHWQVNPINPDDCFTYIAAEADPVPLALETALQPIAPTDRVQFHVCLVQHQQDSAVVVRMSHLCADGSDGKYLLRKLCQAYHMILTSDRCVDLQIKYGSRNVEQVYQHLNRKQRLRLLKDPRTRVKSVFPFRDAGEGKPTVLWRTIPAEKMAAIHNRMKQMGATVNDLLLAACYDAYAETAGLAPGTPVSIMSMMDLRKHCPGGDSAGLCNLTGPLVTVLPDGLSSSFDATLAEIARQTRHSKKDPYAGLYGMPLLHAAAKTLPLNLLLAVSHRVYGSMSLGLTNVGNIDSRELLMGSVPPDAGWFGGPVKRKPGVQISAASFGNACSLCIWGYATDEDKMLLDQLLENMMKDIGRVCE